MVDLTRIELATLAIWRCLAPAVHKKPHAFAQGFKWWTNVLNSWNTLASDILDKAEFIENNTILDCLLKLETADKEAKEP